MTDIYLFIYLFKINDRRTRGPGPQHWKCHSLADASPPYTTGTGTGPEGHLYSRKYTKIHKYTHYGKVSKTTA